MKQLTTFVDNGLRSFEWLVQNPVLLVMLLIFLAYATFTDLKKMKIYNWFNGVVLGVNMSIFVVYPFIEGNTNLALMGILGGLIGFTALLIPAVFTGFNMAGDIKFIGGFGLAIGGYGIVLFILLSAFLNLITNLTLVKLKMKQMNDVIPFAPFFSLSFIVLTALTL